MLTLAIAMRASSKRSRITVGCLPPFPLTPPPSPPSFSFSPSLLPTFSQAQVSSAITTAALVAQMAVELGISPDAIKEVTRKDGRLDVAVIDIDGPFLLPPSPYPLFLPLPPNTQAF